MKKIKALGTLILILAVLIPGYSGCKGCNKEKEKVPPANIIVLLDLSDRLSIEKYKEDAKQQKKDDVNNCTTIINIFQNIVEKQLYGHSKSRLQFFIPDQQGFPIDSGYKKALQVFEKSPIKNFDVFTDFKGDIIGTINELYGEVLTAPQDKFTGADIWMWFKDEARHHLDPEFQNYIICISDGYLDFDEKIQGTRQKPGPRKQRTYMVIDDDLRQSDNWKEEISSKLKMITPEGVNFNQYTPPVQFTMIGIKSRAPKHVLHEKDIIKFYWKLWLESMAIEIHDFFPSDVTEKHIEKFLKAEKR